MCCSSQWLPYGNHNTTKERGPQHQVLLLWSLPDIWHQHTGGMRPQLLFLVHWGSIMNPHRDVIWIDGKEMGHSVMTTYHQNAKGEALNMFHLMSSQLLHQ